MTATEQDKELREKVAAIIEYWDFSPLQDEDSRIERLKNEILQLITADRKRVALEARLQEVEVSIIELERSDDPRFYGKDEAIRSQRSRYTQLKQELEKL